ncbi:IS6 family transposase [Chloroflexota bacterium]
MRCKYCDLPNVVKYGTHEGVQRYWCKECKRKFVANDALAKMHTPKKVIASALGMYYGGMPLDSIQRQLEQDYGIRMSESGIYYWIVRFSRDAIEKARAFKPKVGDTWIADETMLDVGGRKLWFWDIIDADTRYLLASRLSDTRTTKDAALLMDMARDRAGKEPKRIITDKLRSYLDGIELVFGANTKHVQGSPFETDDTSTSLIERFHGTLKDRTDVVRGFANMDTARLLTDGWLVFYNFMKEHTTLNDIPPAQKMGEVPFKNWVDIVETARTAPEVKLEDYTVSSPTRRIRITKPHRISKRRTRITPPMPMISEVRGRRLR